MNTPIAPGVNSALMGVRQISPNHNSNLRLATKRVLLPEFGSEEISRERRSDKNSKRKKKSERSKQKSRHDSLPSTLQPDASANDIVREHDITNADADDVNEDTDEDVWPRDDRYKIILCVCMCRVGEACLRSSRSQLQPALLSWHPPSLVCSS